MNSKKLQGPTLKIVMLVLFLLFIAVIYVGYQVFTQDFSLTNMEESFTNRLSIAEVGVYTENRNLLTPDESSVYVRVFQSDSDISIPLEEMMIGISVNNEIKYEKVSNLEVEFINGKDNGYFDPRETIEISFSPPIVYQNRDSFMIGISQEDHFSEIIIPVRLPPEIREGHNLII